MHKIYSIVTILLLPLSLLSQEYVFVSRDTVQTEEEIVDILIEEDQQFLLTAEGDILEIIEDGQTAVVETNNKKAFYEMKIDTVLHENYDLDVFQYFCRGDSVYYACYFDWSYSSSIYKIYPEKDPEEYIGVTEEAWFCYITGIPGGLCISNGRVWYLGNNRIICYNEKSSFPYLFFLDVPISGAKGLSVDSDSIFTTFENQSHSLVRFRIEEGTPVNPEESSRLPQTMRLDQNYPNPFNLETEIRFQLPRLAHINLKIYNIHGQLVKTLVAGKNLAPGEYGYRWHGRDDQGREVPSGLYFYRLESDALGIRIRRMLLVK